MKRTLIAAEPVSSFEAKTHLAKLLERVARGEHFVVRGALDEGLRAPSMVLVEVGNAVVQAHRRGCIRQSVRDELLAASTSLPIALEPIEAEAMLRAAELAARAENVPVLGASDTTVR